MAHFETIIFTNPDYKDNFKGYVGNPPSNKEEYDVLDCWKDKSKAPSWEEVSSQISLQEVYRKRVEEYPQISDQLDALFHAGVFPPEMAAQIQAVKDKYPKGS